MDSVEAMRRYLVRNAFPFGGGMAARIRDTPGLPFSLAVDKLSVLRESLGPP
jgi:hypothetical protein